MRAVSAIRRAGHPDFPKLLLETGFRISKGSYEFWESTGGAGGGARTGAAPPRMRRNGHPVAAYAWHVTLGSVLIVVDLDLHRSAPQAKPKRSPVLARHG